MIRNLQLEHENRLQVKTLDNSFRKQVEEGLHCSPIESKAILGIVKDTFFPYLERTDEIHPGKLVFSAVDAKEPAGKPLKDCKFMPVLLTYFDSETDESIRTLFPKRAVTMRRREMIKRMANEAKEQGTLLTAEDFAYRILNCGMRTICRDLAYFRNQKLIIPLRSQQKDIGRSLTHRAQIVEAYINRKTPSEIKRDWKHSLDAIENYIGTFVRIVCLTDQGYLTKDIAFMLKISIYLVHQFQDLYKNYRSKPEYQERLLEIISEFKSSKKKTLLSNRVEEDCR